MSSPQSMPYLLVLPVQSQGEKMRNNLSLRWPEDIRYRKDVNDSAPCYCITFATRKNRDHSPDWQVFAHNDKGRKSTAVMEDTETRDPNPDPRCFVRHALNKWNIGRGHDEDTKSVRLRKTNKTLNMTRKTWVKMIECVIDYYGADGISSACHRKRVPKQKDAFGTQWMARGAREEAPGHR